MRHGVHHLIHCQGEPHTTKVDGGEEHRCRSPQLGPSNHDRLLITGEPYARTSQKLPVVLVATRPR